jgi:hypothetical protein
MQLQDLLCGGGMSGCAATHSDAGAMKLLEMVRQHTQKNWRLAIFPRYDETGTSSLVWQ